MGFCIISILYTTYVCMRGGKGGNEGGREGPWLGDDATIYNLHILILLLHFRLGLYICVLHGMKLMTLIRVADEIEMRG